MSAARKKKPVQKSLTAGVTSKAFSQLVFSKIEEALLLYGVDSSKIQQHAQASGILLEKEEIRSRLRAERIKKFLSANKGNLPSIVNNVGDAIKRKNARGPGAVVDKDDSDAASIPLGAFDSFDDDESLESIINRSKSSAVGTLSLDFPLLPFANSPSYTCPFSFFFLSK